MGIVDDAFEASSVGSTAVCLGFFDGVHIAHRKILDLAVKEKENGLIPAVLTFDIKPRSYSSSEPEEYIVTKKIRFALIHKAGIKLLKELKFKNVKDMSKDEFVRDILYKNLRAKKVFCGFNFTFGKGGTGTVKDLISECKKYNIEVFEQCEIKIDNISVSATNIKKHIRDGNIDIANKLLGRNFSYMARVEHGNRLGRKLGIPTINQSIPPKTIKPRFGVYISNITIDSKKFSAITNIGMKPTVCGDYPTVETHIPGYDCKDNYGEILKVEILKFIRDEVKFNSVEDLKKQIRKDMEHLNLYIESKL